jgi:predicted metalloendopeptidase
VIGHEISHQLAILLNISSQRFYLLDTQRRCGVHNLQKCLINEYNAFCPLDGACVNGEQTMEENLADIAGLQLAFASYRRETLERNDWAAFNVSAVVPSNNNDYQMK